MRSLMPLLVLAVFTLGASPEQRRETIQRFRDEVASHFLD